jgi:hypothetical protein
MFGGDAWVMILLMPLMFVVIFGLIGLVLGGIAGGIAGLVTEARITAGVPPGIYWGLITGILYAVLRSLLFLVWPGLVDSFLDFMDVMLAIHMLVGAVIVLLLAMVAIAAGGYVTGGRLANDLESDYGDVGTQVFAGIFLVAAIIGVISPVFGFTKAFFNGANT